MSYSILRLGAVGALAAGVLVAAPLAGWPHVVRLPAILVPALALSLLLLRPWRCTDATWHALDNWVPSRRALAVGAASLALVLFWIVLTRFESGEINAVDFTVYFDRPCIQTLHGRPLMVETADFPEYSARSAFEHHAFWSMVPICGLYAFGPSPLWLLAISVIAVAAGSVYVLRILQQLGAGSLLAIAGALAFALNDNTARTLNYGFHPEVLYAWCVPWLIDAGLRGKRGSFAAATLACLLVKEDAVMPLFAATVAIGLHRFRGMTPADRVFFLAAPLALGFANLGVYYALVMPALTGHPQPIYAGLWANYGATPPAALLGMMSHPARVLAAVVTSGFFRTVMLPFLFLPVLGWRWTAGIVPIVAIYSASADPQLRLFGIYYAITVVPFLAVGASAGAIDLARRVIADPRRAEIAACALVLGGALIVGSGDRGYSLRPWRSEIAAAPGALAALSNEPVVLVQSGLYPHAGYDARVKLLTPETLENPEYIGAPLLIAPGVGAYPFHADDIERFRALPAVRTLPGGLLAVRRQTALPADDESVHGCPRLEDLVDQKEICQKRPKMHRGVQVID